ncbi:E3 ubiquitin-protein ligase MARCHF7-like [Mangifera indica]|uniref:E3 ubiquitin-protein ligase MARCHF7-like n=1 Tax=Mangifera indica TaxID=29780 RepID=UPI001CFA53C3|nr:E3 ubiquitin-protein ligase MARCHF7-like [Mangifera indica]
MGNEEEPVLKENDDEGVRKVSSDHLAQRAGNSTEIVEVTSTIQDGIQQDLALEIGPRTPEDTSGDFVRINMPSTPSPTPRKVNFSPISSPSPLKIWDSPGLSSSKSKSTLKNLLPKLSFKFRNYTSDIEKAGILALGSSYAETREKPHIFRTLSLTNLFTPKTNRMSSLPITPISHSNPESMHGGKTIDALNAGKWGGQRPIHRSHSVPVLIIDGSIRQLDSLGGVFRVIPSTPHMAEGTATTTSNMHPSNVTDEHDNGGEDIPVEEAVCRICLIELGEGGDTLKMECSCKGELALAHQECAVKWFSLKDNKICDVCKQEVQNLPVTLLRLKNQASSLQGGRTQQTEVRRYRFWQDVPILVLVSMLAYFVFLEQLLVGKMKSGAIAISLPFSCILGLLASLASTTMVRRKYVWIYAVIQYGLVVLSAHLFYSLLHLQALLSVLLAAFAGFGITMCVNYFLGEVLSWRIRWATWSSQQPQTEEETRQDQLPATVHQIQTNSHHETDPRVSEAAVATDLAH